ncbi:hypothetical protein PR048_015308 [Dryococelus australis]|uniref:Uncharacterized protein n=1 Tax=Dryococelus australis TaxID=614101 RepID=A0ABQ9HGU6_9NEOP|nr:hypothetical protein PR048_015308 [Dryococelus australis]
MINFEDMMCVDLSNLVVLILAETVCQARQNHFIDKKTAFKPRDPCSVSITKYIGQMICVDNQPFSILPTRKHLSTKVIPNLYEECKVNVRLQLEGIDFVSVTTDLSNSTTNDYYQSIIVHFLNIEF